MAGITKVLYSVASLALIFLGFLFRASISEAFKKTWLHARIMDWCNIHIGRRIRRGNQDVLERLRRHAVNIHVGRIDDQKEDWVYWPVTLREMTVIHKAQCCVLRLLKTAGFNICLVIFDCDGDTQSSKALARGFRAEAEKIIDARVDRYERVSLLWKNDRDKLSQKAEVVLRGTSVGRFMDFLKKDYEDEAEQTRQSVWQFISPAIQCAVLDQLMGGKNVFTLSGRDELDMWDFLRDEGLKGRICLSHIAISQLNRPPAQDGGPQVDMKTDDNLIRWSTDQAMRQSLLAYEYPDSPDDTGNLLVWLINHFCCIPSLGDTYTLGAWNFNTVDELLALVGKEHKDKLIDAIVKTLGPQIL